MAFFSIIIPVCNRAGLMENCIRSIRTQSFSDFEVLFVDDGSTDETPQMLADYCRQDNRFRTVTHPENRSILAARYTGMQEASGEYILFVDSDDEITDNALALLHERLQTEPVDILRFGHEEVYLPTPGVRKTIAERNRVLLPPPTDSPLRAMLQDQMAPNVWKNCYSRAVAHRALRRAENFYCNMGEDVYWSTVFFSCAESDGILEACLYRYFIGGGMSTSRKAQTKQQLTGYIGHLADCITHVRRYLSDYEPDLLGLIRDKYLRMNCFLMLTFIIDEPDYGKVVEFLSAFDTEDLRSVYRHGCNTVLPFKLLQQYSATAESTGAPVLPLNGRSVNYLEDLMKMNYEDEIRY